MGARLVVRISGRLPMDVRDRWPIAMQAIAFALGASRIPLTCVGRLPAAFGSERLLVTARA